MRVDIMARNIIPATSAANLQDAKRLFREYAASLDFDLGFQDFDQELAGLPGAYSAPSGALLLGFWEGQLAGCVALRKIGQDACEMKRLYVRPKFRGLGIGRALAQTLLEEAKKIGYRSIRLDTVPAMKDARRLYESLGFTPVSAYRYNPIPGAEFLELKLSSDSSKASPKMMFPIVSCHRENE